MFWDKNCKRIMSHVFCDGDGGGGGGGGGDAGQGGKGDSASGSGGGGVSARGQATAQAAAEAAAVAAGQIGAALGGQISGGLGLGAAAGAGSEAAAEGEAAEGMGGDASGQGGKESTSSAEGGTFFTRFKALFAKNREIVNTVPANIMAMVMPGARMAMNAMAGVNAALGAMGVESNSQTAGDQAAAAAEAEGASDEGIASAYQDAYSAATKEALMAQLTADMTSEQAEDYADQVLSGSISQYNTTAIETALATLRDVDTSVEYTHTLADLSGIQMDAQEKALLDQQKQLAIDLTLNEIEDAFQYEGQGIIAQQIQNLGSNALTGTIGQEFIKRWQEREAKTKASALGGIESTYLSAERQAIDAQKQRQIDMWGKEYEADVSTAELGLEKAKSSAALQFEWDRSYMDRLASMRGQDISAEQQGLDRALRERMGSQEYDAWEDANKWGAIGSVAGTVLGSDWVGDMVSSWF